jgi:hypothetical protein
MSKTRPPYPEEFRREAVELVRSSGPGLGRGDDELAGPARGRRPGIALLRGHAVQPAGLGRLYDRRAAIPEQPERGLHRAAEGVGHRDRPALPAQGVEQHVHGALSAVGQGQLDRLLTGSLQPARYGGRNLDRREAALEAVGRDQPWAAHGASRAIERSPAPRRCFRCVFRWNLPLAAQGALWHTVCMIAALDRSLCQRGAPGRIFVGSRDRGPVRGPVNQAKEVR